jgi:hypothetical protein
VSTHSACQERSEFGLGAQSTCHRRNSANRIGLSYDGCRFVSWLTEMSRAANISLLDHSQAPWELEIQPDGVTNEFGRIAIANR